MGFLAPAMLLGALLAAIPIALHLINRSKPIPTPFPALRFIRQGRKSAQRRMRIKRWLLLAMRMGVVALLAVVLARPLLRISAAGDDDSPIRMDAVLVLDCSYSMAYTDEMQTYFDRAKRTAERLLDRFTPDSRVGLVLFSDQPRRAMPSPTIDHAGVRKALDNARIEWRPTRVDLALSSAAQMLTRLEQSEEYRRRPQAVFLISDLNAAGLKSHPPEPLPSDIQLCCLDIADDDTSNSAVTNVRTTPTLISAGTEVTIAADISARDPDADLLVALFINGRRVDQQLTRGGQAMREVRFHYRPHGRGIVTGSVQIDEWDGLAADNSRPFVFEVRPRPKVLFIDDNAGDEKPAETTWLIREALAPEGAGQDALIDQTVAAPVAVHNMNLYRFDVVIVTNPPGTATWQALMPYVEGGGGLIVLPQSRDSAERLARWAFDARAPHFGLLPGRLRASTAAAPQPFELTEAADTIRSAFRDGRNGDLGEVRLRPVLDLTVPPEDPRARVLAQSGAREPLLVEKTYGRGRILLSASPMDLQHGNLPRLPLFLPWTHQLILRALPPRGRPATVEVGEVLDIPLHPAADSERVTYLPPAGEDWLPARVDAEPRDLNSTALQPVARILQTQRAGVYRVQYSVSKEDEVRETAGAAVLAAAESDLQRLQHNRLRQLLGRGDVAFCRDMADITEAVSSTSLSEVTSWLWPILLALLVAESLLSNRMVPERRAIVETG